MLETWWGRALVASRASRAAYAILKCVCFCYLGLLLPVARWQADWLDAGVRLRFCLTGQMLAAAAGVFCVVRAVPVVWEGRRYLRSRWNGNFRREVPRRSRGYDDVRGLRVQKRWARSLIWTARCSRRRRWSGDSSAICWSATKFPAQHVGRWLARFAGTFWRDLHGAIGGNKRYLSGISEALVNEWEKSLARGFLRADSLPFFDEALQRIAWHRAQGHRVFLVSGTLAPLARVAARETCGSVASADIEVCATELEVAPGSPRVWSGRIAGEHMSGGAKLRAVADARGALRD